MRYMIGVIAAFAIVMWAVTPAHAISLSLDIPYSNEIKGTAPGSKAMSAGSVSGYIVGISTPWWVGVAHEDYNAAYNADFGSGTKTDAKILYTMNDIYLELPVPVISAAVGYGVGTAKLDVPGATSSDTSQYFARLGLRVAMLFDVHLGYHKGTVKGDSGGSDTEFTTMTLGVGASF